MFHVPALPFAGPAASPKKARTLNTRKKLADALTERHEELNAEIEEEVHRIQDRFDPDLMELTDKEIKPRKSDISIERLVLVWLPYEVDDAGNAERVF